MKKNNMFFIFSILFLISCSDNNQILNFEEATGIKATNGKYSDAFARDAAVISGRVAVVSAADDRSQLAEELTSNGAIYIFEKQGDAWRQTRKLIPADIDPLSEIISFGIMLDFDNDIIVVKARERYKKYKNQTGYSQQTVVYVVERSGDTWIKTAKLTMPSEYLELNNFGTSLAVSNGTIVIGDTSATYDQEYIGNTKPLRARGAVYIYQKQGGTWTQTAKLEPKDSEWKDCFGQAVAIDSSTLVVSKPAWRDKYVTPGIVIFEQANNHWLETARFEIEHCNISTGLAISRDTIVVTSPDQYPNYNGVFILQRRHNKWDIVKTLEPPDKAADFFGRSVATNGNYVGVGSRFSKDASSLYLYKKPDWTLVDDYKLVTFWAAEKIGPLSFEGHTLLVGKPSRPVYPNKLLLKLIYLFYKDAFYQQGEICFLDLPDEDA